MTGQILSGREKRLRRRRRERRRAEHEAKMEMSMATEKQVAANRLNAQKSTGPRTEAGKAVSRFNATTHGLTGKNFVLPGEDPAEFEAFQRATLAALKPEDELQADVVVQFAENRWQARRIPKYNAALTACRMYTRATEKNRQFAGVSEDRPAEEAAQAVLQKEFPDHSTEELVALRHLGEMLLNGGLNDMTRLLAYGNTLNRQADRLLKQLKELKAMRATTIEHDPLEADPVECDAEDVTKEVTGDGTADTEPETIEEPV